MIVMPSPAASVPLESFRYFVPPVPVYETDPEDDNEVPPNVYDWLPVIVTVYEKETDAVPLSDRLRANVIAVPFVDAGEAPSEVIL